MKHKNILFLLSFLIFSSFSQASVKKDETAKSKKKGIKETAYKEIFKDKKIKKVNGLITLYKVDGKVYFDFPQKLLNKGMLLGSTIEGISSSDYGFVGQKPHDPLCIYFCKADSFIQIRDLNFRNITDEPNIKNALEKNNKGAIRASFKIKATSPDSCSWLFDATPFFVTGKHELDPFAPVGGFYSRSYTYNKEVSSLADIMAYEDNITVSSYLSFSVTSSFFGFEYEKDKPVTALMKRSLVLLPPTEMRPRINDPRIGVFYNKHIEYSGTEDQAKPVYYANRWNLQLKDTAAFEDGKLTEPVKPVTFYIDNKFPPKWKKYIIEGVNKWNKAFEKTGFKNAIVTRPFPLDDPDFDPNNIKYNCIKYAPTATQNSMGPSWTDPRTGEIINASVYLYHGIIDLISDWLFVQTSVADKRVRTVNIPDSIIGEAISYVTAHEMGHCLGLMHNMGASFAFPVDSLRSPSFTQKYGTTPSIMDYARFNFIAQEGDFERGVRLMPPDIGVYDYYVIKWLYKPLPNAKTPEDEVPVLEKWISEKINDPMYRYGRQQIYSGYDPSAQAEDLGDDQVAATNYAFNNLKFILSHFNEWVKDEDPDFSFRKKMAFNIINIQYFRYFTHVLTNIGGIYLYERYESDQGPAYKSVPKDIQQKSVLFLLNSLEHLSWMDNPELEKNIDGIYGEPSKYLRSILFPYMMMKVANIGFSALKATENPYTREECINDVFDYVWGSSVAGKTPTKSKLSMQRSLVELLIRGSGVNAPFASSDKALSITDLSEQERDLINMMYKAELEDSRFEGPESCFATGDPSLIINKKEEVSGFGYQQRITYQTPDIEHIYYGWLLQTKDILKRLIPKQPENIKTEYQYLLFKIEKALKND